MLNLHLSHSWNTPPTAIERGLASHHRAELAKRARRRRRFFVRQRP